MADNLNGKLKQNVNALGTNTDAFEVHGREIYWRRRRKQNGALFSTVPLEKILGLAFTVRGANTIEKIVSKYWSACSYNREVTTARPLPSGETCSATLLDKHACSISVHTSATRPSAVSYAEYSPSR